LPPVAEFPRVLSRNNAPVADAWGREFQYVVARAGGQDHWILLSKGRDGQLDLPRAEDYVGRLGEGTTHVEDPEADLVYVDGHPVQSTGK
jgi:hypothetical protein